MKVFIGGLLGKPMMQAFGQLGLTTFSNGVNCFAQILGAIARSVPGMYLHVLVTGVGERKRDGVETMITKLGAERGYGRGELAAAMANFRSIANILAPLLYGYSYAFGLSRKPQWPTLLFWSRMITCAILPEIVFRMTDPNERARLAGDR